MKVLLMEYPWLDRETHHYTVYRWYGAFPNPAIAVIGGALRAANIAFDIFDAKLEDLTIEQSLERLRACAPDIVGLSAFTTDIYFANQFAGLIKQEFPNCVVVVGGPHSTVMPAKTLEEFPYFDIAVIAEGEKVMVKIVETLRAGEDITSIPNIAWRSSGGKAVVNPYDKALECHDLDDIGTPVWEMFPPGEMYHVQTTRGCPFPCEFCYRLTGTKVRHKSPENVAREIETILSLTRPDHIFFSDPTFGLNKKKVYPVLDALIAANIAERVPWKTTARFSTTDEELLTRMKRAGCVSIFFGVESGDPEISAVAKQNIDIDRANKMLALCRKLGIYTLGGFIFGHPGETKKSVWETVKLSLRMRFDLIVIGIMVPWPGTQVYEYARRGERGYKLVAADWRNFDKHFGSCVKFDNFDGNFLPRLRLFNYILFYLRWAKFGALAKEAFSKAAIIRRFLTASIFGAQRKDLKQTDMDIFLSQRRPVSAAKDFVRAEGLNEISQ
ncbi:hypothetical protein CU669_10970 [Paramagnetospirillum kuznetsovii]|uniref:Uncharacterized protein n=1 Tax=Paramagnetospirillum kuznetsovii TaxID=2053833 RepID=A0A364NXU9_9PROT|nr:radical SAM protein [Paramagnetospirillum kuznetsovii]RAU21820.1 hypothetical protein CU669_10970 [Paramagnetospirillum kuznetsovii]